MLSTYYSEMACLTRRVRVGVARLTGPLPSVVSGERRHAEALREEVSAVLAPLGLRLAPEKTAELPRVFRTPDYWEFQAAVGFP
jgi:hypothetical protein